MKPTATGTRPRRFQTVGLPSVHPYQGPSSEIAHGSTPWTTRKRGGNSRKARRRGISAFRAGLAPEGSGVLIVHCAIIRSILMERLASLLLNTFSSQPYGNFPIRYGLHGRESGSVRKLGNTRPPDCQLVD